MSLHKQEIHKSNKTYDIPIHGRVVKCFTNNNSEQQDIFPGNTGIGSILFEAINNVPLLNSGYAKPLFPQFKYYPLKNELVWIIQGPEYKISENVSSKNLYYINTFNTFNSSHFNPNPIISDNISFGETFYPKDIQSLISFEGDFILEGRWGNSIRFGSTISSSKEINQWSKNNKSGNPITIIRNGQTYNSSSIDFCLEDINNDLSSIYITSTQLIPLDVASKNMSTFNLEIKPVSSSIFIPNNNNPYNEYDNVG